MQHRLRTPGRPERGTGEQPAEPGRAPGARIEQRGIRCLADPLGDPGGGPGHEGQADLSVRRIGLLHDVPQPRQPLGQFDDPGANHRVQPGGQGGERRFQRQGDAQPARVAADRVRHRQRGRPVRVQVVVAARRVEQHGRVGDRTGEGAVDGDAVEGLGARPGRDTAALRLDPDQMCPGGRDAHRTGAVGAERGRDEPGGDRGGRTT